jgi:hypothetical protein
MTDENTSRLHRVEGRYVIQSRQINVKPITVLAIVTNQKVANQVLISILSMEYAGLPKPVVQSFSKSP